MPIYMKYEGIVGSLKGKHAGWIELESCSLSQGRSNDLSVTKFHDSTSTALFREAFSGSGKKVKIDFTDGSGVPYMTLELEDTMITSISSSGSGGEKPIEYITLNYTKIKYTTKPAAPASDANPQTNQAVWNNSAP